MQYRPLVQYRRYDGARNLKPTLARGHAELERRASGCHRQIERVLKLDLLRLRQTKRARDVSKRLLGKNDRAWSHGANFTDKLHVFDCFREALEAAAILFKKSQARTIDLAVYQQPHETFVTKTGRELKFTLRDIEGGLGIAGFSS